MEDVPSVDERPDDPARPVVCLDETSRQLLGDTRPALPPAPGRPGRHDPEYARCGVANVSLVAEPPRGWREVTATEQRTRLDWAHRVRRLVDVSYPETERIVLVMDRPNPHSPASLYAAFPPAEAKRLADKPEIRHAPKHGSWLNVAELGPAVLERQCLRRRFGERAALAAAMAAWTARRNAAPAVVAWRFTTTDARTKLERLYPPFEA